ncbi:MAG: hypothetical protein M0C28_16905 [Candidatus Moduliflexus flocculans]|nr:hypothetical protein [Candidatus Moduliflexus flocculans]
MPRKSLFNNQPCYQFEIARIFDLLGLRGQFAASAGEKCADGSFPEGVCDFVDRPSQEVRCISSYHFRWMFLG